MPYQYKNKLHGVAILIEETGELFETRAKWAEHRGVIMSNSLRRMSKGSN